MLDRRFQEVRLSIEIDACSDGNDSTTQCNGRDFAGMKKKNRKS